MKGDPLLRNLERDPRWHRLPEKNETADVIEISDV